MSDAIERPKGYEYRANSQAPKLDKAFEIRNATDVGGEIWFTGEIGWDVWSREVIPALQEMDGEGKTITIFLSSGGGDVFDGYAIGNFIGQMKATVNVKVMAWAASIATFIAVKADSIEMPSNSMFMIHEASGGAYGRAEEIRQTATLIDKINDQLAGAYNTKRLATQGSTDGEDFRELMRAGDAWFTAEEAFALGLIDTISDPVNVQASARVDLLDALNAPESVRALLAAQVEATQEDTPPAPTEEELAAQAAAEEEAKAKAEAAAAAEAEAARLAEEAAAAQAAADAEAAAAAEAAQAAEAITAVCRAFEAPDRAAEFIAAKASLVDVRKALWKAAAARDAQLETDPTPPAAQISEGDAYAKRADKARNDYASALTR